MWDKEAGLPRETMVPETFMDKPLCLHFPIIQKPLVVVGMVTFVTSLSLPCCAQEVLDRHTAMSNSPDLPVLWS